VTDPQRIERILQVHTRYRQAGGEDEVVEAEKRLLTQAGLDVRQVTFDNADLRESESLIGDLSLAASAIWSSAAKRRVGSVLDAHHSQVMHVHNTFTAASPSVYAAAAERGIPVVQTLHNYRLVCPAATVFRDGKSCTDCVGRPIPWPGVLHACVRGSRRQSLVAGAMLTVHRARGTYARGVAAYVALTAFQREMMIDGGLPAARIRVVPNFLEPDPGPGPEGRTGLLFVGRLAVEKGIPVLLAAASAVPRAISVMGAGPLQDSVEGAAAAGLVTYLGSRSRTAVGDALRQASALVLPSNWFEGFPLVLLEAYASGTPVIASRIGSLTDLVEDGVTGLHVAPNDAVELADLVRWAKIHPEEMRRMGANARSRYEGLYRGEAHLEALMSTYRSVVPMSRPGHAARVSS